MIWTMTHNLFLLFVFGLTPSHGMKLKMEGSVNFGKEVMDTLNSYYMNIAQFSGRRSMSNPNVDTITTIVEEESICKAKDFCPGSLSVFVNDYVIALAKAAEGIFAGVIGSLMKAELETRSLIFEKEIKEIAGIVKNLIDNTNSLTRTGIEQHVWSNVLKKINAEFQESVLKFVDEQITNAAVTYAVKKKLKQKLIIAMVVLEGKHSRRLCEQNKFCDQSNNVCTSSLNIILDKLIHLPDAKLKEFMKIFNIVIAEFTFYSKLDNVTANEFKIIVNDMAYNSNVPTIEVLSGIQNTVQARLENEIMNDTASLDAQLLHVILSDMDHFYYIHKMDGYRKFLASFIHWSESNEKLDQDIVRQLMKDISKQLTYQPLVLVNKIMNEVKVFLEITVDPEKS